MTVEWQKKPTIIIIINILCRENGFFHFTTETVIRTRTRLVAPFNPQHLHSVSVLLYRKTHSEGMRNRLVMEQSKPKREDLTWRISRVKWQWGQVNNVMTHVNTGLYGADAVSRRPSVKIMTTLNPKKRPNQRFETPENNSPEIDTLNVGY